MLAAYGVGWSYVATAGAAVVACTMLHDEPQSNKQPFESWRELTYIRFEYGHEWMTSLERATRFEGLVSRELRDAIEVCDHGAGYDWVDVTLDKGGFVTGVTTSPDQVAAAACVLANTCGLQFAGLGATLRFWL